jgi:hypothetical protein
MPYHFWANICTNVSQHKIDTCKPKSIAALFTLSKLWNQLMNGLANNPAANNEWIQKMWYICTMESY